MPGDIDMIRDLGEGASEVQITPGLSVGGGGGGDDGSDLGQGGLLGSGGGATRAPRSTPRAVGAEAPRLQVVGTIDRTEWRIPFVVFQAVGPWAAVDREDRRETVGELPDDPRGRGRKDQVGLVYAYLNDVILRDLMAERMRQPDNREYNFAADALSDLPSLMGDWVQAQAALMADAQIQGIRERLAQLGAALTPEQLDEVVGITAHAPDMPAMAGASANG